jgi:hypothetical protein
MDAPDRGNERQEDGSMDEKRAFWAMAMIGDHGKPYQRITEVTVVREDEVGTLYEADTGIRTWVLSSSTCETILPTREAAENWCADRLEADAAPALALAAQLREQAAARVAQQEVVSV